MKGPKNLDVPEDEPPDCLTDGSNDPLPREYIHKWKVTEKNKLQRLKELIYTINMLRSKGVSELVAKPKSYERDFYLLSKGMFVPHNSKTVNRQLVLKTLLDNNLVGLLKDYWEAVVVEFEQQRKDMEEGLTTARLWKLYAESPSQKHITDSLVNCYNIMLIFWNGSDWKVDETLKLIYDGVGEFLLTLLDTYMYTGSVEIETSHALHKLTKSALGTIHNCCHKYVDCIADLRRKDALRIVGRYRNAGTSTLKTKSILCCSYLLTENTDADDRSLVELDQSDITFVIKILQDALRSTGEMSKKYGYHAEELITGLNNIATVDCNKSKLVSSGVLPLYVEAMNKTKKPALQESAAKAIWTLAFDSENLRKIKEESGCMAALKELADSSIPHVKAAADGALWKIEGETAHLQKQSTREQHTKKLPHVMLSYQWGVKDEVVKLRQKLREEGYRVWIDVEQMSGSTLQSMARAVELAAVFVPVLTERYKASPACRQEAEYGHHLQKKFVPIRLQSKYRPDGWLGFLLGSTYFYDLTKEAEFEKKFQDFVKAIGDDGKVQSGEDIDPVYEESDDEDTTDNPLMATTSETQMIQRQQTVLASAPDAPDTRKSLPLFDTDGLSCQLWSCQQVSEWLTLNKLEKYVERLKDVDGTLLAELVSMRYISSDVYYDVMRQELDMMMLDLLKFNSAIRQLVRDNYK